jgi:bacterioferritin
MVTYNLALTILEQKVEHEEDLQSLCEDLDLMVQRDRHSALHGEG